MSWNNRRTMTPEEEAAWIESQSKPRGRGTVPSRAVALVDDYVLCVVPGCMVRTRVPTKFGTCPTYLWDNHHERWNGARIRQSREAESGGVRVLSRA